MTYNTYQQDKLLISKFRAALYDCDAQELPNQLREVFAPDCAVRLTTPFGDLDGPDGLFEQGYRPLLAAIPDLERRDFIVMAGLVEDGGWVGCAGHYRACSSDHGSTFRRPNRPSPCATTSSSVSKTAEWSRCRRFGTSPR